MTERQNKTLSASLRRQFLVASIFAMSLLGCQNSEFHKELQPAEPRAVNGIYHEKNSILDSTMNPEEYGEFRLSEGKLEWVRINEVSQQEAVQIAEFVPTETQSMVALPSLDLEDLAEQDPRLQTFARMFRGGSQVEVRKIGGDLEFTEKRGDFVRSFIFTKFAELPSTDQPEASSKFYVSLEDARELRESRSAFLALWENRSLLATERVTEVRFNDTHTSRSISRETHPDESFILAEEGLETKKIIRMNRLQILSSRDVLINEIHSGEIRFEMREKSLGEKGLYLIIDSAADSTIYQATYLEGFVEELPNGFSLTQLSDYDGSSEKFTVAFEMSR